MNGYSIFLMIELARCFDLIDKELEYDTTWSEGSILLSEFEGSKFDVDTKSEYDCIHDFLLVKKNGKE